MSLIFEYDFVLPERTIIEVDDLPEFASVVEIQGNPDQPTCRGGVIAATDGGGKRVLSIEVPDGQEGYRFLRLWLEAGQPVGIKLVEDEDDAAGDS